MFITVVYLAVVVGIGAAVGRGFGSNVTLAVVATALVAVAFEPVRGLLHRAARRLVFGAPTTHEVEAGVAVHCLGAFRVFRDGDLVPLSAWQSKKARTLLKILVSRRGRATTREFLMDALWPDEDPAAVARRLSVALATVRVVLDPDKRHPPEHFVIGDKDAVRLDLRHLPVDVEQFLEAATTGLGSLDRGDAAVSRTRSSRPRRTCTPGTSSSRTSTRTGRSRCVTKHERHTSRCSKPSPDWRKARRPSTRRFAPKSASWKWTRGTRGPTSDWCG